MNHIIGASGFIGTKLISYLNEKGVINNLHYSDEDLDNYIKLNLLSIDEEIFNGIQENDLVIFLAAISSPDICEKQYELARKINILGTETFIEKCLLKKAKVVFFSSDVVYGDSEEIKNENDDTKPYGKYAEMKKYIEDRFKNYKLFKVLRLSYVLSENDKFFSYLEMCYKNNSVAEVYDGLYRNVIMIEDVLESIYNILLRFDEFENWVFNVCGEDNLSRVHLAQYYREKYFPVNFRIVDVPNDILTSRPNKIKVQSIYLDKLLKRKPYRIIEREMK